jgi:SAM-dependent methyltransferase
MKSRQLINFIVCPRCKSTFDENLICKNCGYKVLTEKGVYIFPSETLNFFRGYCKTTGLEAYLQESPNPPSEYYPRFIDNFSQIVLDVGGGDGWALARFAENHPNSTVFVIDADFENIVRVPKRNLKNMIALNATATKLPFPDNSVDVIFSLFMVEHMYEYSSFLLEAKRVLKEGGQLIIGSDGDFFDKWIKPFIYLVKKRKFKTSRFLEKYDCYKRAIHHHNLKSPYQAKKFIEKHGFFIQDIRLHLIAGRRFLGALLYELIIPKAVAQKFLTTTYLIIARKI